MKNYQVWALADVAIFIIAAVASVMARIFSGKIIPVVFSYAVAVIVFVLIDHFLGVWYYSGVSPEKRMNGGDEEYNDRNSR